MAESPNPQSTSWPDTLAGFAALLVGIGIGRFAYPLDSPHIQSSGWILSREVCAEG
jgi:hypothetical protein